MHQCIFCGQSGSCNTTDCGLNIHTCQFCLQKFYQTHDQAKKLIEEY